MRVCPGRATGVKVAALSCDDVDSHSGWVKDIEAAGYSKGKPVTYPIIADPVREIAVLYGMLDPEEKTAAGLPLTCRAVFIVGPDKKLKLSILYPATTGRNFDEVLRVVDSLQVCPTQGVGCGGQGCVGRGDPPLQGAQPTPSHRPPDAKCQRQRHL